MHLQENATIIATELKDDRSSLQEAAKQVVYRVITEQSHGPVALYTPTRFSTASNSALQSVSQAAHTAGRFTTAAGANSLMAFKSAAHHSALSVQAAATAVVELSNSLATKTRSMSHRTSLAVYQGLQHASVGVMSCLGTGTTAVRRASYVTVAALGSFGSDVTDAARVVIRDAPAVARSMQQDLGSAALDVNKLVHRTGAAVGQGLSCATYQVSVSGFLVCHHPYVGCSSWKWELHLIVGCKTLLPLLQMSFRALV